MPHTNNDQTHNQADIWEGDVLHRRNAAKFLQGYLDSRFNSRRAEQGFVLAINGEWGYGKSFLIERWKEECLSKGHPSIYFDAWQNDFTENPLLAFIAELEESLSQYFKTIPISSQARTKAKKLLRDLWKPAVTILATASTKHLLGMSLPTIKNIIDLDNEKKSNEDSEILPDKEALAKVGENLKSALDKALEGHRTTKVALKNFKEKLGHLISFLTTQEDIKLPIYIFVDELDRCRPSYAIELLEGIKHLFGVPGVYFVVATNLSQLSESIKAVYGAGFDGERYLRRFFDLQYTLSEPSNEDFSRFLTKTMSIPDAASFLTGLDHSYPMPTDPTETRHSVRIINFVLSKHADAFRLPLRDQKQIATLLEACLHSLQGQNIHIFFLIFLAVLYHQDQSVFNHVARTHELDIQARTIREVTSTSKGQIEVPYYNDNGQVRYSTHNLADIAKRYLSKIRADSARTSTYEPNFPDSLFNDIERKREGTVYWASYRNYFDVVQQAGGFTA